jgi:hypothetical protein
MSFDFALGETGGSIAGLVDRIHELLDGETVTIEKDGGLSAGEIDFDFVNAGVAQQRLLDRSLALMTVHAFDLNDGELIPSDIRWHWWNSHNYSLVLNLDVITP